ncbi:hypothetical protein [Streptomyces sp. NPDC005407]
MERAHCLSSAPRGCSPDSRCCPTLRCVRKVPFCLH